MDEKRNVIEQRFNSIVVFFYCLLIFFLPISIALVESMAGFVILSFMIKKITLCVYDFKWFRLQKKPLSLLGRIKFILSLLKPVNCYLNVFLGLFIGVVFVSALQSQHINDSMLAFVAKLLEGYFLYYSFVDCVTKQKYLKAFLGAYLASVTLMAVNGIFQYFVHTEFVRGTALMDGRVSSSLRHANDFGAYLILGIPLVLGIVLLPFKESVFIFGQWIHKFSKADWILKCSFLVLLLSLLTCMGLTFSRGSWIGFWFSLVFLAIICRRNYFYMILIGLAFSMVFMPSLIKTREVSFMSDDVHLQRAYTANFIKKNHERRVREAADHNYLLEFKNKVKDSLEEIKSRVHHFGGMGRVGWWAEGCNLIKQRPIWGSGLNTYSKFAPYPHNCYLQMAVEIGILGLGAFLAMIFGLFWHTLVRFLSIENPFLRLVLAGSISGLAGFLIQSFFDTTLYSVQLGNLMWIFIGLIVAVERLSRAE